MKIEKFIKIELKIYLRNLLDMIFGKKHEYRRNLVLKRRNNNIFIEDGIFTLFLEDYYRIISVL